MEKTSLGIEENVEGALCYVFGWLTGIIFYILEKDNKFVRFHAMQSIITFLALTVISVVLMFISFALMFIPYIGWIIGMFLWLIYFLLSIAGLIFWIIGIIKAFQGEKYKFPVFGNMAEKYV
jgi:uncharacterized membrane protein